MHNLECSCHIISCLVNLVQGDSQITVLMYFVWPVLTAFGLYGKKKWCFKIIVDNQFWLEVTPRSKKHNRSLRQRYSPGGRAVHMNCKD